MPWVVNMRERTLTPVLSQEPTTTPHTMGMAEVISGSGDLALTPAPAVPNRQTRAEVLRGRRE